MRTVAVESERLITTRDSRVAVFARVESLELLAELICEVTGISPTDALFAARGMPGLLPHPFSLAEAESLVKHLSSLGVRAAVIGTKDLPDMSQFIVMHHARIAEDALEICDLRGDCTTRISWDRLAVIAVGCVPGKHHMRFNDEGRPSVLSAAPMPSAGRLATRERPELELWLLCCEPAAVYCLKHDEFNYETLADECAPSAAENFDRFVRRLVNKAPQARRTPGTYAFLQRILLGYECKSSEGVQQQALLAWALERSFAASAK